MLQQKNIAEGAGKAEAAALQNKAKGQPVSPKERHFGIDAKRSQPDAGCCQRGQQPPLNVSGQRLTSQQPTTFLSESQRLVHCVSPGVQWGDAPEGSIGRAGIDCHSSQEPS